MPRGAGMRGQRNCYLAALCRSRISGQRDKSLCSNSWSLEQCERLVFAKFRRVTGMKFLVGGGNLLLGTSFRRIGFRCHGLSPCSAVLPIAARRTGKILTAKFAKDSQRSQRKSRDSLCDFCVTLRALWLRGF